MAKQLLREKLSPLFLFALLSLKRMIVISKCLVTRKHKGKL